MVYNTIHTARYGRIDSTDGIGTKQMLADTSADDENNCKKSVTFV